MLCKCHWIVLYTLHFTAFCLGGGRFFPDTVYMVIHNYGNPYEKWNIFVTRPHLWLQLDMVKPEIMLCETVLNLSTLNTLTYLLTY